MPTQILVAIPALSWRWSFYELGTWGNSVNYLQRNLVANHWLPLQRSRDWVALICRLSTGSFDSGGWKRPHHLLPRKKGGWGSMGSGPIGFGWVRVGR